MNDAELVLRKGPRVLDEESQLRIRRLRQNIHGIVFKNKAILPCDVVAAARYDCTQIDRFLDSFQKPKQARRRIHVEDHYDVPDPRVKTSEDHVDKKTKEHDADVGTPLQTQVIDLTMDSEADSNEEQADKVITSIDQQDDPEDRSFYLKFSCEYISATDRLDAVRWDEPELYFNEDDLP